MIYRYEVGFDINVYPENTFSLTLQRQGVTESVVVDATDIAAELGANLKCLNGTIARYIYTYTPQTPSYYVTMTDWSDSSFVTALQAAMAVQTAAAGWTTTVTCSQSATTGKLTCATADGTTSFRINPGNEVTQYMLGHRISDGSAYAVSHTGYYCMQYTLVPSESYTSKDSGLYCQESISSIAAPCSNGSPYGVSRGAYWMLRDWSHVGESNADINADINGVTVTKPFGWSALFAQCARGNPFVMVTNESKNHIFWMRDTAFQPKRMWEDCDDYWEISIKTFYHGYYGA